MISTRTFEILDYTARFGYLTRLSPWIWDPKKRRLSQLTRKRNRQHKYFSLVCLALIIGIITYYTLTVVILDVPFYQIAVVGSVLGTFVMSIIASSMMFLNTKSQLIFGINGVFRLNELQMAEFKLKERGQDGFSKWLTGLHSMGITMLVVASPAIYITLKMDWKMWWLVHYVPLPWPEIWTALFIQFLCIVVYFINLNGVVPLYLAIHVLTIGMDKNSCVKMNPSRGDKLKARHLYRVMYIVYQTIQVIMYDVSPVSIAVLALNVIAVLYSIIAMYTVLNIFLTLGLINLVVIELGVLYTITRMLNEMTTTSVHYNNSYKSMDEKMTKYDKVCYRSFRPLVWHIRNFFSMNMDFFLMVMEFIIAKVVDLLLANISHQA